MTAWFASIHQKILCPFDIIIICYDKIFATVSEHQSYGTAGGLLQFLPILLQCSFDAFIGAFCHPRHFFAVGCRSPPPSVLEGASTRTGRKERSMSREKNIFEKFPKKWPKGPFGKPVRGERETTTCLPARREVRKWTLNTITGTSSTPLMRSAKGKAAVD